MHGWSEEMSHYAHTLFDRIRQQMKYVDVASIAQLAEHALRKCVVLGSIPSGGFRAAAMVKNRLGKLGGNLPGCLLWGRRMQQVYKTLIKGDHLPQHWGRSRHAKST